ncbi:MAG TPA: small, acid-soluble spore protein, alpha/beta type [Thermaerobacter sp.]
MAEPSRARRKGGGEPGGPLAGGGDVPPEQVVAGPEAEGADDTAITGETSVLAAGVVASPWDAVMLPPTATSRRRRKRGHRGGVGRRGGRRVTQPNPEDDPLYPFKVQAAKDLGLWAKVEKEGWGALTSLESGRLGGYMQRLVKEAREEGRIPPSATET